MRFFVSLAAVFIFLRVAAGAGDVSVLHRFGYGPAHPFAAPTVGADGLLYGSTEADDPSTPAVFYRVTAAGKIESLGSIDARDGLSDPVRGVSRLTLGADGKLWGTASVSGTGSGRFRHGVVFTLSTDGTIASGNFGGAGVVGGSLVLPGPGGKMYTIAANVDSPNSVGVLLRFDSVTSAALLANLDKSGAALLGATSAGLVGYYFSSSGTAFFTVNADGSTTDFAQLQDDGRPLGLVEGRDGGFYGVTQYGGVEGFGEFFRVTRDGRASVLASLQAVHGGPMSGGLTLGSDGKFYGLESGFEDQAGAFFRYDESGNFEELSPMPLLANRLPARLIGLLAGSGDTFYACDFQGGPFNAGRILSLAADGSTTTVASFEPWGARPVAPLAIDASGNLYGITAESGPDLTGGLIYRIAPDGTYSLVAILPAESGAGAQHGLTLGSDGNLYGTTSTGGTNGLGTVFRATPAGVVKTLGAFSARLGEGASSPLTLAANKALYGVCGGGGSAGGGTVFAITPAGVAQKIADLAAATGTSPAGSLALGPDHALYGTALNKGGSDAGTIFRVGSDGTVRAVVSFDNPPAGGLTAGFDGALYGLDGTPGSFFRWSFKGAPAYVEISGSALFLKPELAKGADGRLYGLTYDGSNYSVYRLGDGSGGVTVCGTLQTNDYDDWTTAPKLTPAPDGALCGVTGTVAGAVFRVSRLPENGAPLTENDVFKVAPGAEVLDVLANDTDPDGDRLTITAATGAKQGDLRLSADHILTYTARPGYAGTDSFTYTASDGHGGTTTGTVALGNTSPTANDFTAWPHVAPLIIDALAHAADEDAQPLRIASVGVAAHGKAVLWSGKIVYTPGPDFAGDDSVTYTVTDGYGGTATATIHLVDKMLAVSGTFSGSVRTADDSSTLTNIFRLTLSRSGAFTASFPGEPGAVTGTFDGAGKYEQTIRRFGIGWRVELQIDPVSGNIKGEVGLTGTPGLADVISGGLQRYSPANPFAQAGIYTFTIDPSQLTPNRDQDTYHFGTGFGVANVTPGGSVQVTGRFCDGTPFSAGSAIFEDHSCVFLSSLAYGVYEPGTIKGDFHFKDDGTNDLGGEVSFVRDIERIFLPNGLLAPVSLFPPGYYGWLAVVGSLVNHAGLLITAPATAPNTTVEFSNDYFDAEAVDRSITWAADNTIGIDPAQKMTFRVDSRNGMFAGSYFDPETKRAEPFSGVVLQRQGYGAGLYWFSRGNGGVTVTPNSSGGP